VLSFADPAVSVVTKLIGQTSTSRIDGLDLQPGISNFFHGNDPDKWTTGVPHYAKVKYTGVYPGIDLIYYGNERQLEYDFEVHPFVNPSVIQMEFEGVDSIQIAPEGDLVLFTPAGEVRHHRPIAFQRRGTVEEPVDARFVLAGNRVSFHLGDYDPSRLLVIDPKFTWSSFIGATGDDLGNDITLDNGGNVYVTGYTQTVTTQPPPEGVTPPVPTLQTDPARGHEVFVTKLNSAGALVFTTYIGGAASDEGHGVAVDLAGSVYITGFTSSTDFPTVNPFQPATAGVQDAYFVKLNSTGDTILLASYLGGDRGDRGIGIAVDDSGNAFLTGSTHGDGTPACVNNFPVVNAIQPKFGCGLGDGFVTKVTPAGTIGFSTFLGGAGEDIPYAIAVDGAGDVVIAGRAQGINFPVANAMFPTFRGGTYDGFITKLKNTGSSFIFSTYYGGIGDDEAVGLSVDQNNTIYVTGYTNSPNFPLKNAPQSQLGGFRDAFLVKMQPNGTDTDFSIYIGAEDEDGGVGVDVSDDGFIYVVGFTTSLRFYAINSISGFLRGARDGFVIKIFPDASNVIYSTYLGGFGFDGATAIAVDGAGDAHVTGFTTSFDFPVTDGAFQETIAGFQDSFIVKINDDDVKSSSTFSFAAGGGAQLASAGLNANPTFGYVSVDVAAGLSPTGLAIIDLRAAGALINEVSIPIPVPTTAGRFFALTSATASTAVTFVNPNSEDVTIETYFTRSSGGSSLIQSFTLPANRQISGFLSGPPFNVPFDEIGSLTFLSTLPVSAVALLVSGVSSSEPVNIHLPIMNPFLAHNRPVFIPQIVDGEGWSTTMYLINSTEEPISGEIRFFRGGAPGEASVPLTLDTNLGVNSVFSYTIEGRGVYQLIGNATVDLVTGFAEVVPAAGSATPFAFATLQGDEETGFLSTTVEAVEQEFDFKMYAEISGNYPGPDLSATPAISIANTSAAPVTVNLSLLGFDGTNSGLSAQVVLQPREHLSRFLREIPGFQNLPSPYFGVVRATTAQPGVVFTGFRARYNEVGHFLVTATSPLRDLGNINPVIFPHLVDGAGFATQIVVISGAAGGGASGTIRLFDGAGRPLNLAILSE
jgi:hypothetical protein